MKASMQPPAATSTITAQIGGSPVNNTTAMIPATAMPLKAMKSRNKRRSSQSAIAPESIPRKNKGAMRAAAATPTMNADPVMSKTSHPTATCSMPVPSE